LEKGVLLKGASAPFGDNPFLTNRINDSIFSIFQIADAFFTNPLSILVVKTDRIVPDFTGV
jgi:hypothetical protein